MFREFKDLLQHMVQLQVAIPIKVHKVEPFLKNDEQHYKVHFPSNLEPSVQDSLTISNSEILLYLAKSATKSA